MDLAAPPTSHRVVLGDDGHPVVVKVASTRRGAARLAGEAATLRALAHPRVVQVVAHTVDAGEAALHLRWVGPHTLATIDALPAPAAAQVVAEVAEIVDDLHRRGLTHRRLTPDHVLLDSGGRPVLTGFADAVTSLRATPADDVAALGELLVALTRSGGRELLLPERRRRRIVDDHLGATLLTLADRARGHGAGPPPSAADLAEALHTARGHRRPRARPRRRLRSAS